MNKRNLPRVACLKAYVPSPSETWVCGTNCMAKDGFVDPPPPLSGIAKTAEQEKGVDIREAVTTNCDPTRYWASARVKRAITSREDMGEGVEALAVFARAGNPTVADAAAIKVVTSTKRRRETVMVSLLNDAVV